MHKRNGDLMQAPVHDYWEEPRHPEQGIGADPDKKPPFPACRGRGFFSVGHSARGD